MKRSFIILILLAVSILSCASKTHLSANITKNSNENLLSIQDSILNFGLTYLNTPYRFGSSGPKTFDCSGFTSFIFRRFGYKLEHDSRQQAKQSSTVKKDELKKGDLVFFEGRRRNGRIGHVGIVYEKKENGEFDFLHASIYGVKISSSNEPYYAARFVKGGRVIENNDIFLAQNSSETKNEPEKNIPEKEQSARYHTVKKGETLNKIAQMYDVPVATIKTLNSLKSNRIKKGMKLVVSEPIEVSETNNVSNIENVNTTQIISPESTQDKLTNDIEQIKIEEPKTTLQNSTEAIRENSENQHKVQHGETLFAIAKKYNLTVEELKELNHLETNMLSSGQILYLKKTGTENNIEKIKEPKLTPNDASEPIKEKPEMAQIFHKVKKGETLNSIAERYNLSVKELKKLNHLTSNNISIGQKLKIRKEEIPGKTEDLPKAKPQTSKMQKSTPDIVKHTVKKGDNLYTLAKKYDCTVDKLKEWNNLSDKPLQIGQKLIVRK